MKVLIFFDPETKKWERLLKKNPGKEFKRMAEWCGKWYRKQGHDVTLLSLTNPVENSPFAKRQQLFYRMKVIECGEYDRVVFFCHGHPKALNRKMITAANIDTFCNYMCAVCSDNAKVIFYSCKTAKLINGFAAQVHQLCSLDVVGHSTSGHTSMNPNKFLFKDGDCIPLAPSDKKEFNLFDDWMHDEPDNAFWFVENKIKTESTDQE